MDRESAEKLLSMPLDELIALANRARREGVGSVIETCGIVNAKSGLCGEDCRFCAQSARHKTGVNTYPLIDEDAMVDAARKAKNDGAIRFGIVTSGNRPDKNDIKIIARAVRRITEEVGIMPCASLGAIDEDDFITLKTAGLTRYHHNIETSENYYTKIVTTHAYAERIRTIKAAKNTGLEVCSGGILGLGESWNDRLDMAFALKELDVDAVPINFLVPIKGTPLGEMKQIAAVDAIRAISIFRLILIDKTIKVAAGRETVLKDFQGMMYAAGANGMLVGGYLTVAGRSPEEDKALISEIKKLWNG